MDIWLIEGGDKRGPYQSYQIRERIERGELDGGEMAWHEACPDWMALREMELFRAEFEPEEPPAAALPPPLPASPRPFVRFWARWFDLHLYLLGVFGIMRLLNLDMLEAFISFWFMATYLIPWVILESIGVHLTGTTPGKWLLAIEVRQKDGERLSLAQSVRRAFRVFVLGMGLNFSILLVPCHGFALWYTLRFRESLWDRFTGHGVRVGKIAPWRVALFAGLFFGLLSLNAVIMKPVTDEMMRRLQEEYPALFHVAPGPEA